MNGTTKAPSLHTALEMVTILVTYLHEVRGLFTRANILARRFGLCSVQLKLCCLSHSVCLFMVWCYEKILQLVQ